MQKNLKEMLAPSSYPKSVNSQINIVTPCNSCYICKHYLVTKMKFTSKITDKTYFIKGDFSCNSKNKYLITCGKCKEEYIGSAANFKPRFRVHKSGIKTTKVRFKEKCLCSTSPFTYVKVKSLKRLPRKTHRKLKKCFGLEKNTGKVNYSQLPIG